MDHPRSRGVYPARVLAVAEVAGSSPLARGLPVIFRESVVRLWIIPARAGFTEAFILAADQWKGSSPLARGLLQISHVNAGRHGIIPARAGFTITRTESPSKSADHPRSRGVYLLTVSAPSTGAGSSPLARGLPGSNAEAIC